MWKHLMVQTRAEKHGMLDGIGLFFGAVLGTNLASLNDLSMVEFAFVILLLAGAVMSLRIYSTTERRWHGYLLLAVYTAIVAHMLFFSKLQQGIDLADRQRLAIILGIWMGCVVLAELTPLKKENAQQV